jgi:uncharacterized protein YjbJ (UPF0337 family)
VTERAVVSVKERRTAMGGKLDQVKGRIKEAAGVLTDDDRLKREGKLDQVVGKVKGQAERAVDKVKDALTAKPARVGEASASGSAGAVSAAGSRRRRASRS